MKKYIFLLTITYFLLIINFLNAQTSPTWVKTTGYNPINGIYIEGDCIKTDASKNVYYIAQYNDGSDLNPDTTVTSYPSNGDLDIYIQKLDSMGNHLWTKTFGGTGTDHAYDFCLDAQGNIYITGYIRGVVDMDPGIGVFNLTANVDDIFILKLDVNGNFVWAKNIGGQGYDMAFEIEIDPQGNLYMTGIFFQTVDFDPGPAIFNLTAASSNNDVFILKLDSNGNFVWAKSIGSSTGAKNSGLVIDVNGNIYVTGSCIGNVNFGSGVVNFPTISMYITKLDGSGNFIWVKGLPCSVNSTAINNIVSDLSGNIYIAGDFYSTVDFDPGVGEHNITALGGTTDSDIFIEKIDPNGNMVWVRTIRDNGDDIHLSTLSVDASENIYIGGDYQGTIDFDPSNGIFDLSYVMGSHNGFLEKLDHNGNLLWARQFNTSISNSTSTLLSTYIDDLNNIYLLGGLSDSISWGSGANSISISARGTNGGLFVLKLQQPPNNISGQIVFDSIANCTQDTSENGIPGLILQFANGNQVFYAVTDSQGFYSSYVDYGNYNVVVTNASPYAILCPFNQQTIIDTNQNVQTINWTLQNTVECPLLEVDIAAPFLRMTNGGSYYTVSYFNNGTVTAYNAYVDVDIDPNLTVLGTSIPIANQSGQVYTFSLGDIAVAQGGYFTINVIVNTTALGGQTHCTEAHIYPDSICTPNLWTGAIINTDGNCMGDSILFTIQNIGSAMSGIRHYYVVEDNIMMRTDTFILGGGQSTTVIVNTQPGSTYQILAEQESGFPAMLGNSLSIASVEGCVTLPNGHFNTGFVTQFATNNSSPFIAVDCQQNVGSFDPNDKAAQPEGYDVTNHYIHQHTDLDYKIRFQNTGTDTAFLVVIRDTLSAFLDPATIEMGASSHPYTWRLYGQGILEVTFNNILLPDSNVNELASHGFFKYSIQQKANNPIGTVIYNSAAIYFDFNLPVITNTTWHTVGENFILTVSIDKIFDETILAKVYPNPFTHSTTMEIQGKTYEELQLTVFDLMGREIARENAYYTNQLILQRGNLQPGIYVYKLEGDSKMIHAGKIVVQE